LLVVGRLAEGPVVIGRLTGGLLVLGLYVVPPPGLPAGLESGAAGRGAGAAGLGAGWAGLGAGAGAAGLGGGGGAGFLFSALAMLASPRNTVRIIAADTFLMAL
jgi:hypothetical protein